MIAAAVILWTLVSLSVAAGVWGYLLEPNRLQVTPLTVPLPRLPAALAGLRVAHLSDLHLSGKASAHRLAQRACREALRHAPELICLTGDVVNGTEHRAEAVEVLSRLAAPAGVYLVLGNHDCDSTLEDYLWGHPGEETAAGQWREALAQTQVTVLDNEWRAVHWAGEKVVVAGIGDVSDGRDDLPRTVAGAPQGGLHLLLSHSPDALDLPQATWANLLLAGHTHGGQMQLPGCGSPWAPVWRLRHRASGLLRLGETVAFITRGIGSGTRVRLNCPPQLAILTLQPGSPAHLPATVSLARNPEGEKAPCG